MPQCCGVAASPSPSLSFANAWAKVDTTDISAEGVTHVKALSAIDPEGLIEYSVVYTDRSLNHMSQAFQGVMRNISSTLKQVYNAQAVAVVPGSGTFGMEAVARQFANGQQCLVIRNGWFSYRWSQILEMGNIPAATTVLKARPVETGRQAAYAPPLWTKCWRRLRRTSRRWSSPPCRNLIRDDPA